MEIAKAMEVLNNGDWRHWLSTHEGGYADRKDLWEAIETIEALLSSYGQANDPLLLPDLKKMNGKPVWFESKYESCWALVFLDNSCRGVGVITASNNVYYIYTYDDYNELLGAKLYRQPPKEKQYE